MNVKEFEKILSDYIIKLYNDNNLKDGTLIGQHLTAEGMKCAEVMNLGRHFEYKIDYYKRCILIKYYRVIQ